MLHRLLIIHLSFVLICSFSSLFAQDTYRPELLIPYNDHGKWGFSDTLGNIQIEPQFESASFVTAYRGFHYCFVSRGGEFVYYIVNKGVVAPLGCKADWFFYDLFLQEKNLSVISKNDKYGLFNYATQQVLIDVEYAAKALDSKLGFIYFSKAATGNAAKDKMTILCYDVNSGKSSQLEYIEVVSKRVRGRNGPTDVVLFRNHKNQWFERTEDGWEEFAYSTVVFLNEKDPRITVEVPLPREASRYSQVPIYRLEESDSATIYSSIEIGDYNYFQVMHKSSGFGLVEDTSTVLPFSFDYIDIDYDNGFFYLLLNKKMGAHIPFTPYSTIAPKYDLISLEKMMKVHSKWQFAIFNVKTNGQIGYVGENGVEYFNHD